MNLPDFIIDYDLLDDDMLSTAAFVWRPVFGEIIQSDI